MTETMRATDRLTIREFRESSGTADWPVLAEGAMTFFATESLAASARLVQAIGEIPGVDDHPPGIEIRPNGVTVHLVTAADDYMGMSGRDLELAREISAAAERLGLRADGSAVESVQPIVIGAADIGKVMPFWAALTGYVRRPDSPDEDLVDSRGRGPGIWFEQLEDPGDGRPRMHFAVCGCRRPRSRGRASRRRSRPAAVSSTTRRRRRGGRSPTRKATRRTSRRRRAAELASSDEPLEQVLEGALR